MIKVFVHTQDREEIEIVAKNMLDIEDMFEHYHKQTFYHGCGLMIDMRKVEYIEYVDEEREDE